MIEPRDPPHAEPAVAPIDEPIYTHAALVARLAEFDSYLASERLATSARLAYIDGSARFLRWLAGDYRPRNAPASLGEQLPRRTVWGPDDLGGDLSEYADALREARMKPLAIQAYVTRADTFLRWLDGRYQSRGPKGPRERINEDNSWLDEANIQAHVVAWLEREGWTIVRQATGREHGTDIDAERGEDRLSVEVKGHPRRLHTFGANKGRPRKWHPAAQARAYYGGALHSALTMLHADPERTVAIALPDVAVYRGLVDRSRNPLRMLAIQIWLVTRNGQVTEA